MTTIRVEINPDETFKALLDLLEAVTTVREKFVEHGIPDDEASTYALLGIASAIISEEAKDRDERVEELGQALETVLYELSSRQRDVRPSHLKLVQ